MDLLEGMQVGVMIDEGETFIAMVHRVDGEALELDLAEAPASDRFSDRDITVFAADEKGLHHWGALASGQPVAGRLSLVLVGPAWVVQRRRYPRYAVDLQAKVRRIRQGTSTRGHQVRVVDLSHGGARIVGNANLAMGDAVMLDLDVGGDALTAPGLVAMAYPDGHGRRVSHIAFKTPEELDLTAIDLYLDSLESTGAT